MKSALTKLAVLGMAITLVGCSSANTQSRNTGAGAVTGAVVGGLAGGLIGGGAAAVAGGAILGALVGGVIGHSMDHTDNANVYTAVNSGHSRTWKNAATGTTYTVRPTSNYITINGNPYCRHFTTTAIVSGKAQKVNGTACRRPDGSWQTI